MHSLSEKALGVRELAIMATIVAKLLYSLYKDGCYSCTQISHPNVASLFSLFFLRFLLWKAKIGWLSKTKTAHPNHPGTTHSEPPRHRPPRNTPSQSTTDHTGTTNPRSRTTQVPGRIRAWRRTICARPSAPPEPSRRSTWTLRVAGPGRSHHQSRQNSETLGSETHPSTSNQGRSTRVPGRIRAQSRQ